MLMPIIKQTCLSAAGFTVCHSKWHSDRQPKGNVEGFF
jgi:hypothetical protein